MGVKLAVKISRACNCACSIIMAEKKHSVNFACLGNICRSPMAEAVFRSLLEQRGLSHEWLVDSSAVESYNIGSHPDPRTLATLQQHGLNSGHVARRVTQEDFHQFEYILCFDQENMRDLGRLRPAGSRATLRLLGSYLEEGGVVQDPYYSDDDAFEQTYKLCLTMCTAFLESVYK